MSSQHTKILNVNNFDDANSVKEAAKLLKNGELVAFPTETVYGLGANGLSTEAVMNIFTAKGRPSDNPLILHIGELEQLDALVSERSELANQLIESFWPGALTLVMKRSQLVPDIVTAKLDTVAIRMPPTQSQGASSKKCSCRLQHRVQTVPVVQVLRLLSML